MDNELVIGIDLAKEQFQIKEWSDPNRSVLFKDTKVTKQIIGGYIANTLSLTDKFLLSGGYRLEANKLDASQKGGFSPYTGCETHRGIELSVAATIR